MILRERRLLAEQGFEFRLIPGEAITPQLIDQYYSGHEKVCRRYGNRPWLPKATWIALQQAMPESLVMAVAFDGDQFSPVRSGLSMETRCVCGLGAHIGKFPVW